MVHENHLNIFTDYDNSATDARVEHTNRKIDLAKQHGVKFVVLFSALGIRSSAAVPHVDLLKHCASIEV